MVLKLILIFTALNWKILPLLKILNVSHFKVKDVIGASSGAFLKLCVYWPNNIIGFFSQTLRPGGSILEMVRLK